MCLHKFSFSIASVIVLAAGVPAFANEAAIIQDSVQTTQSSGSTKNTSPVAHQKAPIIMRILLFIGGVFTRKVSSLLNGNFLFCRSVVIQSESSFDYFVAYSK